MDSDPDDQLNTAILIFAHFLGIDVETERHLLYIAQDALGIKGLPAGWNLGFGEGEHDGIPYFFNTETGESVWNHPREAIFQRKVKEEKEKDKKKRAEKERRSKEAGTKNSKDASQSRTPQKGEKPSTGNGKTEKAAPSKNNNNNKAASSSEDIMEVTEFEDELFDSTCNIYVHTCIQVNTTMHTFLIFSFLSICPFSLAYFDFSTYRSHLYFNILTVPNQLNNITT